LTKNNFCNKTG